MAVSTDRENEARMRLLAIIQDFNDSGKSPSYKELSRKKGIVGSLLNWDLSELLDKEYVDQITNQGFFDLTISRFKISDKGKHVLNRYYSKAKYFVSKLNDHCKEGSIDELFQYLEDHRDILRFAYYRRLITKKEIEKVAKKLDISTQRIWWGDHQGSEGLPSYPDKMVWPTWEFKRSKRDRYGKARKPD